MHGGNAGGKLMISEVTLAVFWFACGAAAATTVAFIVVVRLGYIIKALRQSCTAYRSEIKAITERDTAFLTDKEAVEALYNHGVEQRGKIFTMWALDEELKNAVEMRDSLCIGNVLDIFVTKYDAMRMDNLKQNNEILQLRGQLNRQRQESDGLKSSVAQLQTKLKNMSELGTR